MKERKRILRKRKILKKERKKERKKTSNSKGRRKL